jgi:ABC-2 type transport system permease protein
VTGALDAIYVVLRRDLTRYFRERTQLVGAITRPALWLFIMGYGMQSMVTRRFAGANYVEFVFPGMIAMAVLFTSMFSAISVIWDREFGFLKGVLVAPIPQYAPIVGKALSGTALALIQGGIVMIFAPVIGVHLGVLVIVKSLAIMALIGFAMTSVGLIIASRMTSFEGFGTIMNFVVMPLFFLSGAMFDTSRAPALMRAFIAVNPLSYGVDALRSTILGAPPQHAYWLSVAVMAGLAAVLVAASTKAFMRIEYAGNSW